MKQAIMLALLLNAVVSVAQAEGWPYQEALAEAVDHSVRTDANRDRDRYRHPAAVLQFFDVQPQMTLVEIWPATGWWTEILGPYTHDKGIYYAAGFATTADNTPQWRRDMQKSFAEKLERNPEVYDHIVMTELGVPERTTIAPPGTVDRVLTFRNVHNWMKGEYAEGVFTAMYRALKPGGILGVVEHRAKPGTDLETMIRSGYVTEAYVIEPESGPYRPVCVIAAAWPRKQAFPCWSDRKSMPTRKMPLITLPESGPYRPVCVIAAAWLKISRRPADRSTGPLVNLTG